MVPDKATILLIEDDTKLAASVCQGLTEAGYRALRANNGEEGFYLYSEQQPDVVLLDLNLPGRDGIDILQTMRKHSHQAHVIIISARDTIDDRVTGLDSGADDYLNKPFAFPELLARIRVHLRRGSDNPLQIRIDDLFIDLMQRMVKRQDQEILMTPREFELLDILARHQGSIVSRETIARDIWKVQRATPLDNVIDVHMMHLRKKINIDHAKPLIHTIRGMGFLLSEKPEPN